MKGKLIFTIFSLLLVTQLIRSQAFSNEIGIYAGPTAFFSDYGQRGDFETNFGNVGFSIGFVHYFNFSYTRGYNIYSPPNYVKDHFKIRNEFTFTQVNLEHFGEFVAPERTSLFAQQLRAMSGQSTVYSLGSSIEFYPLSIKAFENNGPWLSPHVGIGFQYSFFTPEASSTLGPLSDPEVSSERFANAFSTDNGATVALVGSVGSRIKVSPLEDIIIQGKWQLFFSDFVDGFRPDPELNPDNRSNDWMFSLFVGYILYLE